MCRGNKYTPTHKQIVDYEKCTFYYYFMFY